MTELFDILNTSREQIIDTWAAQSPAADTSPEAVRENMARGYDNMVRGMRDYDGTSHREYVETVVKPVLRRGVPIERVRENGIALEALIGAEIDHQVSDATERQRLHQQLSRRMGNARAVWEMVAIQFQLERSSGAQGKDK